MKLIRIIFFMSLLVPNLVQGQDEEKKDRALKAIELKKEINDAKKALTDGAMLVRLHTKQKSIDLLREAGREQEADITEKKQREYNLLIIESFKSHFALCPTYFFLSGESQKVLDGAVKDINFLDENLQPDGTIDFTHADYLVAEFGNIEQVEGEYYDQKLMKSGEEGVTKEKTYYGATDFGFPALIVRNKSLVQMKKPFPYYVRTFSSLPFKRSVSDCVKKLNRKLRFFAKGK